ncbi:MAG: suppressor of fused domain protein [Alphaproteobacteria bacterium]|nr:suppressor of fused domain protein [Alphaproteobacteria bacterium]
MDLEQVWAIREDDVYPSLFGSTRRGIFPLALALFTGQFGQTKVDPRWLHHGVIEFAPTASRRSWLYVTSGHSNPWEQSPENYDKAGDSGAGVEFALATTEQGDWAIQTVQSMLAFDILLCAGRYPGKGPLAVHDRIPLQTPLNRDPNCLLRNLVVTDAEGIPAVFQLPSGSVRLMAFTGLTDAELSFAKANGSLSIIERLREAGFHPINNPGRPSIL